MEGFVLLPIVRLAVPNVQVPGFQESGLQEGGSGVGFGRGFEFLVLPKLLLEEPILLAKVTDVFLLISEFVFHYRRLGETTPKISESELSGMNAWSVSEN